MILFKGKQNDLSTTFPPMLKVDGRLCVRNGISSRSKFMVGLYDIALYLSEMSEDPHHIIASHSAKQIRMVTRRELKGSMIGKALKDGLKANCTADEYQRFEPTVNELIESVFKNDTLQEGELFTVDISSTHGVRLSYESNQDLPYLEVEGFDQAVLKTWLGDNPVSEDIKKDLLGKH